MAGMISFDERMRGGGAAAIEEAARFFMKTDPVHQSLRSIAQQLGSLGVEYAVIGGMALVAHGYDRTTVDVDILISAKGLDAARKALEGRGYLPVFEGSKQLRDTRTGVRIEFVTSGGYPGDGKPKPVVFPEPSSVSIEVDGIHYVRLTTLIELKLASGMTNPGRLRDLADVQELIRVRQLPRDYAEQLNPYVRGKYTDLWVAVHQDPSGSLES